MKRKKVLLGLLLIIIIFIVASQLYNPGYEFTSFYSKAGFHSLAIESETESRAYDLYVVKVENRSCKQNHKLNGIGVGRIRTFPFLPNQFVAYDPVKTRLSESEAEAEEPTNRKARNRTLSLAYSSASACTSDNTFFT